MHNKILSMQLMCKSYKNIMAQQTLQKLNYKALPKLRKIFNIAQLGKVNSNVH